MHDSDICNSVGSNDGGGYMLWLKLSHETIASANDNARDNV